MAVAVVAVAALGASCSSSSGSDGAASPVTGAQPTVTTVGGAGPAVRVASNDFDSVRRLFEAWVIDQEGDGFTGACAGDLAALPANDTWCSISVGTVTGGGETYLLGHPGADSPEAALLVGPSNGYFVITEDFTLGSGTPPAWVGTAAG